MGVPYPIPTYVYENLQNINTVNDRISPRHLTNRFYPWGLSREGVLFEIGDLLN